MAGWLSDQRTELAAERILDAAEELFSRRDAAAVGMADVATAAGCSRATLYRYFENRDVLYTAFVHRETRRVFAELGRDVAGIVDPRRRLLTGIESALRSVRENPALASWFAATNRPIGGEMAERSEVIQALTETFLHSLGVPDVQPRARWLVRILVSLLTFPGRDVADERALLEDFVLPAVLRDHALQ
jgi:AcrR family transcriptional regulator